MNNWLSSSLGAVFEEIRRSGPANDVGKGRRMTGSGAGKGEDLVNRVGIALIWYK